MSTSLEEFKARFRFTPDRAMHVGAEREAFIVNRHLTPAPVAADVLEKLDDARFTYELSACQVEARTSPHATVDRFEEELVELDTKVRGAANSLGYLVDYSTIQPESMPLDVFPVDRYISMTRSWSRARLAAACRITGTHIHVGMRDHESALRTYNRVRKDLPGLCSMGDLSEGRRLAVYKSVAPNMDPPEFESWDHLHRYACDQGFVDDVRQWWGLVRISCHGSLEFRLFDSTSSIPTIVKWARTCRALCLAA